MQRLVGAPTDPDPAIPTPKEFRRRRGTCCVGDPRRYPRIACGAPSCICPCGASERGLLYFHHRLIGLGLKLFDLREVLDIIKVSSIAIANMVSGYMAKKEAMKLDKPKSRNFVKE
jgi:hypothetical protein